MASNFMAVWWWRSEGRESAGRGSKRHVKVNFRNTLIVLLRTGSSSDNEDGPQTVLMQPLGGTVAKVRLLRTKSRDLCFPARRRARDPPGTEWTSNGTREPVDR